MIDTIKHRMEGGRRLREGKRTKPPILSVITVVYSARRELPPLLETVFAALHGDLEVIVIDGGSNDGTVEFLSQSEHAIDYWLSEPDNGIYDAMNKGLAAATGEYILHLNAGDGLRFIPWSTLKECLAQEVDVACFRIYSWHWGIFRPKTGLLLRIDNTWHHQGTFYRRKSHPGYDIQYRVFSDFDCNQKLLKAGKRVKIFRDLVADQYTVGISGSGIASDEYYRIIRKNFGVVCVALAVVWRALLRVRLIASHIVTLFESTRANWRKKKSD